MPRADRTMELLLNVVDLEKAPTQCYGNCANVKRSIEQEKITCGCCSRTEVTTAFEICTMCQLRQKREEQQRERDIAERLREETRVAKEKALYDQAKRMQEESDRRARVDVTSWVNESSRSSASKLTRPDKKDKRRGRSPATTSGGSSSMTGRQRM